MISFNDLSPYEFLLLCMHIFSAVLYIALGIKTIQSSKYLMWNTHIYPRMAIASFGIALVFLSEIVAQENYNIFFYLFMWLHAFNQFAEIFRLSEKYHRIEELESRINMKNLLIIVILLSLTLSSCAGRKVELENIKKEQIESRAKHQKEIETLTSKVAEKEQQEVTLKQDIQDKKSKLEKLEVENKKLLERIKQERKDDVVIKNADGMVTIIDSEGNTYQIPSTEGTEISQKSESTLTKELENITFNLSRAQETNEFLQVLISQKDMTISEKVSEINSYKKTISEQEETIKKLESEKKKNSERKSYPVWYWLLAGSGGTIILILVFLILWRTYVKKK